MDVDVYPRSITSPLGVLVLALTLIAFGLGHTGVADGFDVTATFVATYVGGVALFVLGVLAFRDHDAAAGSAFVGLGAFWFTWASIAEVGNTSDAVGLFLLLFALLVVTFGAAGQELFRRSGAASKELFLRSVIYALFFLALLLLSIAHFADHASLAKAAGWIAVAAGALAWYDAMSRIVMWPPALTGRFVGERTPQGP